MSTNEEKILDSLDQIKKILMLVAISNGVTATVIAKALGVNKSTISRAIPVSDMKTDR